MSLNEFKEIQGDMQNEILQSRMGSNMGSKMGQDAKNGGGMQKPNFDMVSKAASQISKPVKISNQ